MEDHPLNPRLEAVERRLDRMEAKLDQIVSIETAIREMSIISTTFRKEIDKVWDKVDDTTAWRQSHIAAEAAEHAAIIHTVHEAATEFRETTDGIRTDVNAWINQNKGRDRILVWTISLVQSLLIASLGWQFLQIEKVSHTQVELATKIEQLQK